MSAFGGSGHHTDMRRVCFGPLWTCVVFGPALGSRKDHRTATLRVCFHALQLTKLIERANRNQFEAHEVACPSGSFSSMSRAAAESVTFSMNTTPQVSRAAKYLLASAGIFSDRLKRRWNRNARRQTFECPTTDICMSSSAQNRWQFFPEDLQPFAVTPVLKVTFVSLFFELLRLGHNELVGGNLMMQTFNGLSAIRRSTDFIFNLIFVE